MWVDKQKPVRLSPPRFISKSGTANAFLLSLSALVGGRADLSAQLLLVSSYIILLI